MSGFAKRLYLEGQTFNGWTVGKYVGGGKYECTCVCGTVRVHQGHKIRKGGTLSCGCLREVQIAAIREMKKKPKEVKPPPVECLFSEESE